MASLSFREQGEGAAVVLIHGFPFHQEIWNSFAKKLSAGSHVITIDLPGFGKSPLPKKPFSLDDVAQEVISFLTNKDLTPCSIIGHSLGGYVMLGMAAQKPSLFPSLTLFHSTAYGDGDEKKQSRNKVIEFVNANGAEAFTSSFIAPLFANDRHPAIEIVRTIARTASADAVRGYTLAMRDRPDRTVVLNEFAGPILFLSGEKDAGITAQSIRDQSAICRDPEVHILPQVAHMGMFENENECLKIIQGFLRKSTVTS